MWDAKDGFRSALGGRDAAANGTVEDGRPAVVGRLGLPVYVIVPAVAGHESA